MYPYIRKSQCSNFVTGFGFAAVVPQIADDFNSVRCTLYKKVRTWPRLNKTGTWPRRCPYSVVIRSWISISYKTVRVVDQSLELFGCGRAATKCLVRSVCFVSIPSVPG